MTRLKCPRKYVKLILINEMKAHILVSQYTHIAVFSNYGKPSSLSILSKHINNTITYTVMKSVSIHAFGCDKDGGGKDGRKELQDDRRAEI